MDEGIIEIVEGLEVVAEGMWCLVCQVLEDTEDIESKKCVACGCEPSVHVKVKVVTA